MPARGIHHVAVLGPVGLQEEERYPSDRGTEEVVYLYSELFVFDPDRIRIEVASGP